MTFQLFSTSSAVEPVGFQISAAQDEMLSKEFTALKLRLPGEFPFMGICLISLTAKVKVIPVIPHHVLKMCSNMDLILNNAKLFFSC